MPFPGNMIGAPVMAAKQGMKDISFAQVTDTAQPVLQYVDGPLTGKGSGLLTPVTQTFAGVTQNSLTQASQAPGKAIALGGGSFSPGGGGGGGTGAAPSGMSASAFDALGFGGGGAGGTSGAGASQSMAAAQAMMAGGSGSMGSAAAMAGSGMGSGPGGAPGGMGAGAAAAAAGAGGAGLSSLPGLTPGQLPGAPQFTPLPALPSMPRLSDVLAKLGGMITGGGATGPGSDALSGAGGSGATALPASQFGGSAPADPTEAEFT